MEFQSQQQNGLALAERIGTVFEVLSLETPEWEGEATVCPIRPEVIDTTCPFTGEVL